MSAWKAFAACACPWPPAFAIHRILGQLNWSPTSGKRDSVRPFSIPMGAPFYPHQLQKGTRHGINSCTHTRSDWRPFSHFLLWHDTVHGSGNCITSVRRRRSTLCRNPTETQLEMRSMLRKYHRTADLCTHLAPHDPLPPGIHSSIACTPSCFCAHRFDAPHLHAKYFPSRPFFTVAIWTWGRCFFFVVPGLFRFLRVL